MCLCNAIILQLTFEGPHNLLEPGPPATIVTYYFAFTKQNQRGVLKYTLFKYTKQELLQEIYSLQHLHVYPFYIVTRPIYIYSYISTSNLNPQF